METKNYQLMDADIPCLIGNMASDDSIPLSGCIGTQDNLLLGQCIGSKDNLPLGGCVEGEHGLPLERFVLGEDSLPLGGSVSSGDISRKANSLVSPNIPFFISREMEGDCDEEMKEESDNQMSGVVTSIKERDERMSDVVTSINFKERDERMSGVFTSLERMSGVITSIKERDNRMSSVITSIKESDELMSGVVTSLKEREERMSGVVASIKESDERMSGVVMSFKESDERMSGVVMSIKESDEGMSGVITSFKMFQDMVWPCIPVCKLKDDMLDACMTNTTDICSPTCSSSPDSVQTIDQEDDELDQGEDSGLESGGGGGLEQFSSTDSGLESGVRGRLDQFSSTDSGLESAGSRMGQFSSTDDNSSSSCSLLSTLAADTSHLPDSHVTSFHVASDQLPTYSSVSSTNLITPDTSRSCTPISIGAGSAKFADTQYKLAFPWKPHSNDVLRAEFKTPEKVKNDKSGYNSSSSSVTPSVVELKCKWSQCDKCLEQGAVLDHIRQEHVDYQQTKETFVCLWEGCKVYNRQSCSLSWLERHVISHSGTKPFRCIVDGCLQRFTSESGLERHVNGHFSSSSATQTNGNSKGSRSREDTPTKRRKKMRWKRPWRARTDDYLNDSSVLDQMKLCLIGLARNTEMDFPTTGSNNQQQLSPAVTFHGSVIGQRKEHWSDSSQYLLHWMPENILPDSWVCETDVKDLNKQIIPLSQLPREAITQLSPSLYRQHRFRKHRRK